MHILSCSVADCSVVLRFVILSCCGQGVSGAHLAGPLHRLVAPEEGCLVFIRSSGLGIVGDPTPLKLFVGVCIAINVPRVIENDHEVIVIVNRARD